VREKLVRALVIDGEFKEAKVQLQRVLRLDPRNELALQDARLIAAIERGAVRLGGSGFELNPGGGR
jgi:protein involved in temperature-dependent protein secretion